MIDEHNDIIEVRTVYTYQEANNYLDHAWILLSTGAVHIDSGGYQAKTYFTLGRKEVKTK